MRTFACLMLIVTCCTLAEGACPVGFHYHGNSCYWFSHIKGDFAEAGSICRFLGSHLVVITSAPEDAFIRGYAKRTGKADAYFIGGSDLGLEGRYVWVGDRLLTYTNWSPGNPSNDHNVEQCLELRKPGYQWNDIDCKRVNNFICERSY
ncbi:perlucin-like [Haliotis rufescens]|uniref:perlucin-like n=1 Tax=Haliotis rufescens TaxID=6454 RepID=UPI001EAF968F|nr:perlucin-like [Haliotis rufescens]